MIMTIPFDNILGAPAFWYAVTVTAVLFASVLALLTVLRIRAGYLDFLALGPGGTPSTFAGFLRVSILSLFVLQNPYAPSLVPVDTEWNGLVGLPQRNGPRPLTKGIAPHRQTNQWPSQEAYVKLAAGIERMAGNNNRDLAIGTSCLEKHGTGLFSKKPALQTCRGEIVHLHGSDGSMHLILHPNDANVVLDAGWGERHPLAGVFKGFFGPQLPVGFLMLYAPHNGEEIDTVLQIISAAASYVNGREVAVEKSFEGGQVEKQHLGLDHGCDVAMHAGSILKTAEVS